LIYPHERPTRVEYIVDRIKAVGLGEIIEPKEYGIDPVLRVHDAGFVNFLESAWREWSKG
jgi:acetoin utilization deacetylase AcuC-like enzyme